MVADSCRVESLFVGLALGAAAGVSPGPLLVLVVTAAMRGGWAAGVLVACAPLVTDVLVIALTLTVLDALPAVALAWIAIAGAAFVCWTGVHTIREARTATVAPGETPPGAASQALLQAAMVNILSPHPWIFWATVMGPLAVATWREQPSGAVALVIGFYVTIVGVKALIGVLVGNSRHRLGDRGYRRALVAAGFLLIAAAAAMLWEFGPAVVDSLS